MLVLNSEISDKAASKRSANVTWSDCSGVFITPHHILTTDSCAKLVKKSHLSSGEVQVVGNTTEEAIVKVIKEIGFDV